MLTFNGLSFDEIIRSKLSRLKKATPKIIIIIIIIINNISLPSFD